jgi:pimeloyl-ACP methyl ester carboxylesterase
MSSTSIAPGMMVTSYPAVVREGWTNVLGADLHFVRTGRGPTVLLLHPLRTQVEYFLPLMGALGEDVEIVALDLPGHGRSSAPGVKYTAAYFTDAVEKFLDTMDLTHVLLVGESIGASIGLALAARQNPRLAGVVASNPYDYGSGSGGGIRRSSSLANVLFATVTWPAVGSVVVRTGTKGILRKVMEGGVYDPRHLPSDLIDELYACGKLPGHARAFRSLTQNWKSWIDARAAYAAVELPVTLIYGDDDWSLPQDRQANRRVLRGARSVDLERCGHFSCLDQPERIAALIREEPARIERRAR